VVFSLAGEAFKTDSIEQGNSGDDRSYVQFVPLAVLSAVGLGHLVPLSKE